MSRRVKRRILLALALSALGPLAAHGQDKLNLTPAEAFQRLCIERSRSAAETAAAGVVLGFGEPVRVPVDEDTARNSAPVLGLAADGPDTQMTVTLLDSRAGLSGASRGVVVLQCSLAASGAGADDVARQVQERFGAGQPSERYPGQQIWTVQLRRDRPAERLSTLDSMVWSDGAEILRTLPAGSRIMQVLVGERTPGRLSATVLIFQEGEVAGLPGDAA